MLFAFLFRTSRPGSSRPRPVKVRPAVEPLDERALPSAGFIGALLPPAQNLAEAAVLGIPDNGRHDLPFHLVETGVARLNADGSLHSDGTGHATHLGRFTLSRDATLYNPVDDGAGGIQFSVEGTATLTAANGDKMMGTATGPGTTLDGVHFTFSLHAVFTSGTGRFAGSSLSYDVTVHSTTVSVAGTVATSALVATATGSFSH